MKKEEFQKASIYALILVVATCLILYIYNPYRIESTIEFNLTRYFAKHEQASANIMKISEKLQPMYNEQYERAMDMVEAESEEDAKKIAEEVQEMGAKMEETFMKSSEYAEIMKLDEEVIQIQAEINTNLDELESKKKEALLDRVSQEHKVEKAQLLEMLATE